MFTGLIQRVGILEGIVATGPGSRLVIQVSPPFADVVQGESIAVDGVCLTAVEVTDRGFAADVSPETLARSVLGRRRRGDSVNLERALRLTDRLGGHLVSGHVDGQGTVTGIRPQGSFVELTVRAPNGLLRYVVDKGSVAVDGISLTVARCEAASFTVAVIPETLRETTLHQRRPGDEVNLEVDILAKYVEKLLPGRPGGNDGSDPAGDSRLLDLLQNQGYVEGR